MTKDIQEIRNTLVGLLKEQFGPLKATADTFEKFEVSGTIEAMQGKKKVDGIYFASVVPKPKDVRLYFFPAYTHVDELGKLPANLQKALKGKSCFHIKQLDEDMVENMRQMIVKSVKLYQQDGLLAN